MMWSVIILMNLLSFVSGMDDESEYEFVVPNLQDQNLTKYSYAKGVNSIFTSLHFSLTQDDQVLEYKSRDEKDAIMTKYRLQILKYFRECEGEHIDEKLSIMMKNDETCKLIEYVLISDAKCSPEIYDLILMLIHYFYKLNCEIYSWNTLNYIMSKSLTNPEYKNIMILVYDDPNYFATMKPRKQVQFTSNTRKKMIQGLILGTATFALYWFASKDITKSSIWGMAGFLTTFHDKKDGPSPLEQMSVINTQNTEYRRKSFESYMQWKKNQDDMNKQFQMNNLYHQKY